MNPELKILLIMNRGASNDYKVLVRMHTQELIDKVTELLDKNKQKEAFNLVVAEGEVEDYIPPGRKLRVHPRIILVEDLL